LSSARGRRKFARSWKSRFRGRARLKPSIVPVSKIT